MTHETQNTIYKHLETLPDGLALQLLINWHGLQLIDNDFLNYLVEEGLAPEKLYELTGNGEE